MSENAQTMTEFTFAPGEKNIVGDGFSPSVIIFWLKTSIAASSTRIQYKAPNTGSWTIGRGTTNEIGPAAHSPAPMGPMYPSKVTKPAARAAIPVPGDDHPDMGGKQACGPVPFRVTGRTGA